MVEHWRKGHVPVRLSDVETLAQVLVARGGMGRGMVGGVPGGGGGGAGAGGVLVLWVWAGGRGVWQTGAAGRVRAPAPGLVGRPAPLWADRRPRGLERRFRARRQSPACRASAQRAGQYRHPCAYSSCARSIFQLSSDAICPKLPRWMAVPTSLLR